MPNTTRMFYTLTIAGIIMVALLAPCIGYAETVSIDITVPCGRSIEEAPLYKYSGRPNTQVSLETVGMLVDKQLFTDLHGVVPGNTAEVLAVCTPQSQHIYHTNMWPPNNKIVCDQGKGLAVRLINPNSDNPTKYLYLGTLTVKTDDKKIKIEGGIPTISLAELLQSSASSLAVDMVSPGVPKITPDVPGSDGSGGCILQ